MNSKAKFYMVGGAVRDKIMGLIPKDFDFSVEAYSYAVMKDAILARGGEIFLETEKFLTIRAKVPGLGAADYVLCRKDGAYTDGRRPSEVIPGMIYDDLARRDFTMNAIAIDIESPAQTILDPFNGHSDIANKIIRCVGDPIARFNEDGLRMFRALRFHITKGFALERNIVPCLENSNFFEPRLAGVSLDRIRDEIIRCFKHDTLVTLETFELFHSLRDWTFDRVDLWLKPTSESR